ncbi:site-2 protease family protein [Candidatus Gottesmanbacteria bacterium]|nr:site-2 protease family protein [Candidatus Gottesmanbacteria bacterium]
MFICRIMLVTAVVFLIILSLLVFVHELGHYLVARLVGVKVEEFGFGLPPRIIGKKVNGTIYSLNWLPIGGFVRLAGEDGEETVNLKIKNEKLKEYFWMRSKKERSLILSAGVAMNFLLAIVLTTYLLAAVGLTVPDNKVTIKEIQADSPGAIVGLSAGDVVAAITYETDGQQSTKELTSAAELKHITLAHLGEQVILTIVRSGQEQKIPVTTRKTVGPGQGAIGITISDTKTITYSWQQAPIEAIKINLSRAKEMVIGIGQIIARLVTFKPLGAEVAGPIGIAQVTGQAVKFGFPAVLEFMSILSLNLAVLNVLPVPALDGGRLLFVFAEKILGRKVKPAFERSTHQIGMIILFVLIFLVSINDILRLTRGG